MWGTEPGCPGKTVCQHSPLPSALGFATHHHARPAGMTALSGAALGQASRPPAVVHFEQENPSGLRTPLDARPGQYSRPPTASGAAPPTLGSAQWLGPCQLDSLPWSGLGSLTRWPPPPGSQRWWCRQQVRCSGAPPFLLGSSRHLSLCRCPSQLCTFALSWMACGIGSLLPCCAAQVKRRAEGVAWSRRLQMARAQASEMGVRTPGQRRHPGSSRMLLW